MVLLFIIILTLAVILITTKPSTRREENSIALTQKGIDDKASTARTTPTTEQDDADAPLALPPNPPPISQCEGDNPGSSECVSVSEVVTKLNTFANEHNQQVSSFLSGSGLQIKICPLGSTKKLLVVQEYGQPGGLYKVEYSNEKSGFDYYDQVKFSLQELTRLIESNSEFAKSKTQMAISDSERRHYGELDERSSLVRAPATNHRSLNQ